MKEKDNDDEGEERRQLRGKTMTMNEKNDDNEGEKQ